MPRKFKTDDKAIYISIFNANAALEPGNDTIQFTVRKAIVYRAFAQFINVMDAATEENIGSTLPQKVCESPEDTEKEAFKFGVFADMPIKESLAMAQDLGRHWQALAIDQMVDQIASMQRHVDAQKYDQFSAKHQRTLDEIQERLDYFRLREIEAVAFPQPGKPKRTSRI